VRIICATHQTSKPWWTKTAFARTCFYRLNVIELRMPPLRECRDDTPLLASASWSGRPMPPGCRYARLSPRRPGGVAGNCPFPGNDAELENVPGACPRIAVQ